MFRRKSKWRDMTVTLCSILEDCERVSTCIFSVLIAIDHYVYYRAALDRYQFSAIRVGVVHSPAT
jgi:hypothetical protein